MGDIIANIHEDGGRLSISVRRRDDNSELGHKATGPCFVTLYFGDSFSLRLEGYDSGAAERARALANGLLKIAAEIDSKLDLPGHEFDGLNLGGARHVKWTEPTIKPDAAESSTS
jgi:hypothetical protein